MADDRPPVWIGHVKLETDRVPETHEFLVKLGMRPIVQGDDFAVLELRGGTHLVLVRKKNAKSGGPAPFDLMVDDLEATHRRLAEEGLAPTKIRSGRIHRSFTVAAPSGHVITFNSSHVGGRPV